MSIVLWVIFGALAGWLASLITGSNSSMGWLANIVVGIIGALVGGWLANVFGFAGVTGFDFRSLLVAIVGAVIVLFGVNAITGRRTV